MINHNIMNLIMNKKALKEWEEMMIKMNKEYTSLYKLRDPPQSLLIVYCKNIECIYNHIYHEIYNYYRYSDKILHKICSRCFMCEKYDSVTNS